MIKVHLHLSWELQKEFHNMWEKLLPYCQECGESAEAGSHRNAEEKASERTISHKMVRPNYKTGGIVPKRSSQNEIL